MSAARQGRAVTACGHSPPALRSVDGAQPSSGPLRTEELPLKRDAAKATAAALPMTTRLCTAGVAPAASINATATATTTPPIKLMAPTKHPSCAILTQGGSGVRAFMVRLIGRFTAKQ